MRRGGFDPLTYEAGLSPPLGRTGALKAADHVVAGSSILTGVGQTCLLRCGRKSTVRNSASSKPYLKCPSERLTVHLKVEPQYCHCYISIIFPQPHLQVRGLLTPLAY